MPAEDEEEEELDLEELKAFLASTAIGSSAAAPAASAAAPAAIGSSAAAPAATFKAFLAGTALGSSAAAPAAKAPPPVRAVPDVSDGDLPLPPGFEHGFGPGAGGASSSGRPAAPAAAAAAAAAPAAWPPWSEVRQEAGAAPDLFDDRGLVPAPAPKAPVPRQPGLQAPQQLVPHPAPEQQLAIVNRTGIIGEGENRNVRVVIENGTEDLTDRYLAAATWEEMQLPQEILDGVYEMGYIRPSKIQEWALPIAIQGGHLIGQAQNGSGKTAAFVLAMLLRADKQWEAMSALCVCHTRELSVQTHNVIQQLGKHTGFKTFLAVQGERPPPKVKAQLVVGTPGKLQDLIKRRVIDSQWCKIMVIDEADHMINEENMMGPQVMQIRQLLPEEVQVLLFSATFPEHVDKFAESITKHEATRIRVLQEDLSLDTITQTYIDVGNNDQKFAKLCELYGALNVGQSIIFVNTRHKAFELAKTMKAEGHTVSLICGTQAAGVERMEGSERDWIMQEFRDGITKVLIATDVLSRGIDVPAVTLVVNYDLPLDAAHRGQVEMETYMHRIGRTGRFGLRGVSVNLVCGTDLQRQEKIKTFYNCRIERLTGDAEEMEDLLKQLR